MTEDQDARDPHSDAANKALANKFKDKKIRSQRPLTKIILRRLPPTMTEEAFLEQVSPIPEHDYFYFTKPDPSLGNNLYSRAYINFVNIEDFYIFRDKFDGYIFLDEKGVEYMGIVEYAPFQRIPKKKKKKDPKCGTIETDPIYQEFVENLTKEPETENVPKLEYSYPISDGKEKVQTTPLLDYLAARKLDKRGRDERRRRENDKRKMRIERKPRDGPIKISEEFSEDETNNADCSIIDTKVNHKNFWSGEERVYKSRIRSTNATSTMKMTSDELKNELNRDCHFPALSSKMHNTFTLSSNKNCDFLEANQKNHGDSCLKEDESAENNEVKKIKPRDWDKDKPAPKTRDEQRSDSKDSGIVFESKSYRDRKSAINPTVDRKKKLDGAKEDDTSEDAKKDKRDKPRESAREQRSKKYSDTRKDRARQNESSTKVDKPLSGSKPEAKAKALNHDDIKPFTQLPQVKTDDLTKLIEEMDKKIKISESKAVKDKEPDEFAVPKKIRRNSLESGEVTPKDLEESFLKRQKSLNDRREKSSEREDSEEKDREDGVDRRGERKDRIRNKDRPSLVIYQPGMGRFSKQRLAKEKSVNESEKRDT